MGLKESSDLAGILKEYSLARARSAFDIVVTGLVIAVNDAGEVLIGQRQGTDRYVPNLSWSFPGSRLESLNFESELTQAFHQRTGLYVDLHQVIAARVIPESGRNGVQVVALYFYGLVKGSPNRAPKLPYNQLKWVKPLEVFNYFTSSTTDEVTRFLAGLEAKAK